MHASAKATVGIRWMIRRRNLGTHYNVWVGFSSIQPRTEPPQFIQSPALRVHWFGTSTNQNHQPKGKETSTERESPDAKSTSGKVFVKNWLVQLKSIPNIITTARIVSAPLLSYLIVTEQYEYALYGCVLAGFSDWLDGYLAKRFQMSTVLGTYLDPFADKVMINVLAMSLCYSGILPTALVALWMGRDIALMGGSYWYVRSETLKGESQKGRWIIDPVTTPLKVNPTNISKANTVLQFSTLSLGLMQPLGGLPPGVLDAACIVTGGTTIASGFSYIGNSAFSKSGNKKALDKLRQRLKIPKGKP